MTRKEFLNKAWGLIALPYILFLVLMTRKHRQVSVPHQLKISADLREGISFFGKVICVKAGDELTIFSSRCTHLGCTINNSENNMLVCPCHGSQFDLEGKVKQGPAIRNMEPLSWRYDSETHEIIVDLQS